MPNFAANLHYLGRVGLGGAVRDSFDRGLGRQVITDLPIPACKGAKKEGRLAPLLNHVAQGGGERYVGEEIVSLSALAGFSQSRPSA